MAHEQNKSRFPNLLRTFRDSRNCGGISIRGIYLETAEDGFVEAPADMAEEMAAHGFLAEARPSIETVGKRRASK